ncbi:sugar phosphate isomerase/epimerase family protein [Sediminibacterium soli]|uniref:sugar phosphate isomerase/epimerase family protein n=1 Tax=Sediminibacterium soli TaxID=2698829 RepID=UPI00137B85F4|nr:sugar phosphate isomerase/epimerase [Sediminibacterium soli]NCI48098.1 sugar phosphate isomerase/epimerase [Sediminibacterium soli]
MHTRRNFLRNTAALTAGSWLLRNDLFASQTAAAFAKPGLQLFTLFSVMDEDVPGYIKKIADTGYGEIESAFSKKGGFYGMSPRDFAKLVKDNGMHWRSHHVLGAPFRMPAGAKPPVGADGKPISIPPMKNLRDNMQELVDQVAEGGVNYLVCANTPIGSLEEIKSSIEVLNKTGEAAKKAGLQFAYHNHDAEFRTVAGVVPYDLILAETDKDLVKMELDLAWTMKAGKDPVELFKQHKGRFPLWHVKDLANNYSQIVELGKGSIDFKRIFDNAELSGMKYYFVEQDGAPKPLENIAASYAYLKERVLK